MIKKYFIGIQDKGRGHFTDLLSDAFASVRANSSAYVYEYQEATTKKQIADTYSPDTRGIILLLLKCYLIMEYMMKDFLN